MLSSAVLRAAKPAAAVALAGGSILFLPKSTDDSDHANNEDGAISSSLVETLWPDLISEWPKGLVEPAAFRRTASCDGSGNFGGLISHLSFGGRNSKPQGGPKRHASISRQATEELFHDTADLNPVEYKYEVDWTNPVGRGMFGDVFRAVNKRTGDKVAIKKIAKKCTSDKAFQWEMDNLLFLEQTGGHPFICAIREHFDPPGEDHFYLVLDLIEGGELFEHLCQYGAYSEADAARVIRQTASALNFLHGIGMVHSDLKPENLMLSSKNGGEATIKIVDFGCAHLTGDGHGLGVKHRRNVFTPSYCPPEVLKQQMLNPHKICDIMPSFDIWSLGIIMYVMLTGAHPFNLKNEGSSKDTAERILSGGRLPIRNCEYTKHLSEDALALLERMMSRDPAQRPSAEELLQHPWVKGDTATSSIISGSDKRLWAYQRHKTVIGSSVLKGLLQNSDKHGGSDLAKRTGILEMAFRDLDPNNRGYISTKELNADKLSGVASFLVADAKLSLNELEHLMRDTLVPLHYSKDEIIYDEGSTGDFMYILQSGSVEVTSKADGYDAVRQSGEFFGEDVLLGDSGEYNHTARCLTPAHVLKISREFYEKCLKADEEIRTQITEIDHKRRRERAQDVLAGSLEPRDFKSGQVIFREGSQGDMLYILESGKVNISVDGHKVRSLQIGEMTGEHASFYAHKAYNVTAKCMSPEGCTMQVLDGKRIRAMFKGNKYLEESFRDIILRRDFKKALLARAIKKGDFPETLEELRAAFDIIDTKKMGKIEFDIIKDAVLQWDKSYTDNDIRDMLKALDVENQDLSWSEFRRIFVQNSLHWQL